MPQVDIYGTGAKVEDKNPKLTAALKEAHDKYLSSEVEVDKSSGIPYAIYTADQKKLVEEAYQKAGLDPKQVPKNVDLQSWYNITTKYNGASGDPQRMLELTVPYDDGRTKDEAGARDAIAMGIANGWDDAKITQYKDQYNAEHSGKEGWVYQNLGIKGNDLAKVALIAAGGWALAPAAGAAGAAATGATTAASGLAGTLGMNAGLAATALNAGALNAGVTLARGGNIGDALKSGATAALFSGVGGWAKDLATPVLGSTAASVASGAATGALGAGITGGDWKQGAITGAISGGINEASKYVGNLAKTETAELGKTASNVIGNTTAAATNTLLRGGNVGNTLQNVAANTIGNTVGGWAKQETGSQFAGDIAKEVTTAAVTNKKPTAGIVGSVAKNIYQASGVSNPLAKI